MLAYAIRCRKPYKNRTVGRRAERLEVMTVHSQKVKLAIGFSSC